MSTSKIKEGQVIENYQGRFAKVVAVKDNRFSLTAWVIKKEDAEKDEKVVRHLNRFGLSQVLGEEKTGDATTETVEDKVSTVPENTEEKKTAKKDK